MNTERILLLADFIESLPDERLDMRFWAKDESGDENLGQSPATHHPLMLGLVILGLWAPEAPLPKDSAGTLLGLTHAQAHDLFMPPYVDGDGSWGDITPAIAAATLRRLAETGRVEWGRYR